MAHAVCAHCKEYRWMNGRGLCQRCHKNPEIREAHEPIRNCATGREPTDEELEAIIAEQMANLPDWWNDSSERELRSAREPHVPKVYAAKL